MADIAEEIKAFQHMQKELEARYMDRWVLIHDRKLIADFDSFESAANDAVRRFGKGPFLIRQVGAPPSSLPISVMYAWPHA